MQLTWKKTWQLLFCIVLLGAGLRLYALGENSFVSDEFLDINSSYGYFKTGEWKAWDFNYGKPAEVNINDARDERAFVYKWQVAQLFRFLPPTESTARLISVLWGLISIGLLFWTGYFYTRKKTVGLFAAFLFAVGASAILFDRRLRMYAMFLPVFLAFSTATFGLFERKYAGKKQWLKDVWEKYGLNLAYALPFLLLGGLSFLVHGLSVSIVPILAVFLLINAYRLWKKGESWKNKYAILVGTGVVSGILFLLALPNVAKIVFSGLVLFDDHYSYLEHIFKDFAHPLLAVVLVWYGHRVLSHDLKRPKEALWLTLSWLVPLAMSVWFWRRNVGPQYIFFAQAFLYLMVAVGMFGILKFVKTHTNLFSKKALLTTLVLLIVLVPNYYYFLEENNTYHETSTGSNPNYRKVFAYFKKNKAEDDVLITRNFRNYYWSGAQVPVFDFGGELSKEKFSLHELQSIVNEHPHGWVILSGNDYDYISSEAEAYIKEHMELVSNSQVRGDIEVYRW